MVRFPSTRVWYRENKSITGWMVHGKTVRRCEENAGGAVECVFVEQMDEGEGNLPESDSSGDSDPTVNQD